MHFSIPDTEEFKEGNGSVFIGYKLHINGVFHCSVRYRQLLNLHQQLCKEFSSSSLPNFPPKKLLPLNPSQLEERRLCLEKYILQLSQDSRVLNNDVFNGWLVWAQNETMQTGEVEDVNVDLFIMNGQKLSFRVSPTLQTNDLLEKACKQLNIPNRLMYYFSLFLAKKDDKELIIVKKLQDFESPYISQRCSSLQLRIVLRKHYWHSSDEALVIQDKAGLNLVYIQTVAEVEKGWILASKDVLRQLAAFQARGAKKEYLELASTLKYYGYMQFQQCICDFPQPNTPVLIAAGNKELNFRIQSEDGSFKEGNFQVTRMRCWRISSLKDSSEEEEVSSSNNGRGVWNEGVPSSLELSFEYLMTKDEMRWVKVISQEAVLISLCLQGMVRQLLGNKNGTSPKSPSDRLRKGSLSFMKRDGSSTKVTLNHTGEPISPANSCSSPIGELSWRRLSERLSEFSFLENNRHSSSSMDVERDDPNKVATVENSAFNIIGDDNL